MLHSVNSIKMLRLAKAAKLYTYFRGFVHTRFRKLRTADTGVYSCTHKSEYEYPDAEDTEDSMLVNVTNLLQCEYILAFLLPYHIDIC